MEWYLVKYRDKFALSSVKWHKVQWKGYSLLVYY